MKGYIKKIKKSPFLRTFAHYYQAADSELTSVAVAYYWLISIFPLLLIAVNILPFFQIPVTSFLTTLEEFLPNTVYEVVSKMMTEILTQPSTGLLSFSILSALWTFSKSMNFLQKAFNKAYSVSKGRGVISQQILSLLVSLGLQILFALSLFFSVFGKLLLNFLSNYWKSDNVFYHYAQNITEPLVYLLLFAVLILLYYFLPNVQKRRLNDVLPGSIFVLILIFLLVTVFSASVNTYFQHLVDVRFFSSIIVVVMMFWFILIAKLLIIGAVLNASVQSLKDPKFRID